MTENQLRQALTWARENLVECLYFLSDLNALQSIWLAEEHAFRLVDIRVTMARSLAAGQLSSFPESGVAIRSSEPHDLPRLKQIAEVSHRTTRFYSDPEFDRKRCDALYAYWIEKSCGGWADVVLVACVDDAPLGYISCHRDARNEGSIGLFAVEAKAQGQGLGRCLLDAAMPWFAEHGVTRVSVITQASNVRAQCLYQQYGFVTQLVQAWYHRWEHLRPTNLVAYEHTLHPL